MTEEQRQSQTAQEQPEVPTQTIIVPSEVPMVTLLGPRDEILRTIEPVSYTHLTLPTICSV